MPLAPFRSARDRLARLLIRAFIEGELEEKNKRSYSPRHLARILRRVAKEREASTSWNTLESWLSQPSVLTEVNETLIGLGSPIRLRPTKTPPPGKIYVMIYGCALGPFGVFRRPVLPRILQWVSDRPKFIDWWLSRPSIL